MNQERNKGLREGQKAEEKVGRGAIKGKWLKQGSIHYLWPLTGLLYFLNAQEYTGSIEGEKRNIVQETYVLQFWNEF